MFLRNTIVRPCVIAIALSFFIADRAWAEEEKADKPEKADDDVVKIASKELEASGVTISKAGPETLEVWLTLFGEIRLNADKLARVVPRFPGVVRDIRASLGEHVRRGMTLAVLESNESLSTFKLDSPLTGTIVEKRVSTGQVIKDDVEAFVVADLDSVWLDLTAFPHQYPGIKEGQAVRIESEGGGGVRGVVSFISPVLSVKTRTATVRAVLPNKEALLKPGLYVRAGVLIETTKAAVAVVKGALQVFKGKTCVFVQREDGFKASPVKVGKSDDRYVEILSGVSEGDSYASTGSLVLKGELSKTDEDDD